MLRAYLTMVKLQTILQLSLVLTGVAGVNWLEWWTYDGISGPSFWGLINPDWALCNQGNRQSPVDLDPSRLLYDPQLEEVQMTPSTVRGKILNTGHTLTFLVEPSHRHTVNMSGGSLSYNYQVWQVDLHWGELNQPGSEHTVDGKQFAGELQIIAYNGELYSRESDAVSAPQGVAGLVVLLEDGERQNRELDKLIDAAAKIKYAGDEELVQELSLTGLLPDTREFITYEGSLTQPPCQESMTWVVMNKPIHITRKQRENLQLLTQGSSEDPRGPMAGNYRPTRPLNGRLLRTNIMFSNDKDQNCDMVATTVKYQSKRKA